jgi:methylglutaconyl-CoA hydratase
MHLERILYRVENHIAFITLNRPEKRNALDDVMVSELSDAFAQAEKNSAVRVIVLTGTGSAFCAGVDLEYLQRMSQFDVMQNLEDSQNLMRLFRQIYRCSKPVVGLVNGPALAGGCGLASVCDFIIADREASQFGYPEVKIGFIPAIVMVFLAKRIGEGKARELMLRGNLIGGQEAHHIGLITCTVAHNELEAEGLRLANELSEDNSLAAMELCKEMLSRIGEMNLDSAIDYAVNMNVHSRTTNDFSKGIESFLRTRKRKSLWRNTTMNSDLKEIVRSIPDFPKRGIVFRDITTLLKDREAFRQTIDLFYEKYENEKIDKVVSVESRGFIFGATLAYRLGAGFIPVRKPGKLPAETLRENYQLEYGTDAVEIHRDAITAGERILVLDDLLATGGTVQATCRLVERLGGNIIGICFLIELSFLRGREKLSKYSVVALIDYETE